MSSNPDTANLPPIKLPTIAFDANKYTRGSLLILAGSARYPGAAVLAALSAARTGAGYVTLATPATAATTARNHLLSIPVLAAPESIQPQLQFQSELLNSQAQPQPQPESQLTPQTQSEPHPQLDSPTFAANAMQAIASSLRHVNAIVCGPGILQTPETCEFLRSVIAYCATGQIPLLLDADALNILSVDNTALNCLRQLASPKILTPHAGELARLLAASYSASLQELACELGAIIVAKGAQTQIAGPVLSTSLGVVINAKSAAQAGGEAGGKTGREAGRETSGEAGRETGNSEQILTLAPGTPALAKAGSGDVLSGIIGSLLAQGMSAREAAIAGVQLHGQAAHLAEQTHGRRSVIPEDLIAALPAAIKQYEERVESQIV